MLKFIKNMWDSERSRRDKSKPRILIIVKNYPQLSQTYIKTEINTLSKDYELKIIATSVANYPDLEHLPFQHIPEIDEIVKVASEFKPCLIHGHYLLMASVISHVANQLSIPFTIRAHSFDAMLPNNAKDIQPHIKSLAKIVNTDLCLGVLAFPFTRHYLETDGNVESNKIIDCPPIVDFQRFYNRADNGLAVINTGACTPKKQMRDFVKLASLVPERVFNLYAVGHNVDAIVHLNQEYGGVLNVVDPVPFSSMPSVYKKHGWIAYTASLELKTVGWPMAIAEAQASGVVACMPNLRPDIKEYIGDSGHIYNHIEELTSVLMAPPDQKKRQAGFDNARQYDIQENIHLLTNLWQSSID